MESGQVVAAGRDRDAAQLTRLGYRQELARTAHLGASLAFGFTYMAPSLAIGLFAYGLSTGGPEFVWTMPLVIFGQFFVLLTMAEPASEWPVAGGIYQWTKHLVGPRYAWFSGWLYLWGLVTAGASVATTAVQFIGPLFGYGQTRAALLVTALGVLLVAATFNLVGSRWTGRIAILGVAAEIIGTLVIGVMLLAFARHHGLGVIFQNYGVAGQKSYIGPFLASSLMAVWIFYGFENCGAFAEETVDPSRKVPKAMILTLTVGGAATILQIIAYTLAVKNYGAVIGGKDANPAVEVLQSALGSGGYKFALIVIAIAFISCVLASQGGATRYLYAYGRDNMIIGSGSLRKLSPRFRTPPMAVVVPAAIAAVIAVLPSSTVARVVSFTVIGSYAAFATVVVACLIARWRGWKPGGTFTLGRWGLLVNVIALLYGVTAMVVLSIKTPALGSGFINRWIVPLSLGLVALVGLLYLWIAKPTQRALATSGSTDLELNYEVDT
jgi:amino acid transporter